MASVTPYTAGPKAALAPDGKSVAASSADPVAIIPHVTTGNPERPFMIRPSSQTARAHTPADATVLRRRTARTTAPRLTTSRNGQE
jgi:hypothetical protein